MCYHEILYPLWQKLSLRGLPASPKQIFFPFFFTEMITTDVDEQKNETSSYETSGSLWGMKSSLWKYDIYHTDPNAITNFQRHMLRLRKVADMYQHWFISARLYSITSQIIILLSYSWFNPFQLSALQIINRLQQNHDLTQWL
jgi:hypothetical protein